jgi:hypothetical protein
MAVFQWNKSNTKIILDYRQIDRKVEVGRAEVSAWTSPNVAYK